MFEWFWQRLWAPSSYRKHHVSRVFLDQVSIVDGTGPLLWLDTAMLPCAFLQSVSLENAVWHRIHILVAVSTVRSKSRGLWLKCPCLFRRECLQLLSQTHRSAADGR